MNFKSCRLKKNVEKVCIYKHKHTYFKGHTFFFFFFKVDVRNDLLFICDRDLEVVSFELFRTMNSHKNNRTLVYCR